MPWIPAFAGMTIGLLVGVSPSCAGSFDEANAQYRAGDFKGAAKAYETILNSGQGTAAVSYNLGNALVRSGQKARALLAYERALQADPRSRDARWNIGVVRSTLVDRSEDAGGWLEMLRRAAGWVAIGETAAVLLGSAAFLVLLGWAGFLWPSIGSRLSAIRALTVLVFILSVALFVFQRVEEGRPRGIVLDAEVVLRYGPAFSETKAFVLHEGASVDVLDESGDWWYVSFGKNSGWIPKKAVEIV